MADHAAVAFAKRGADVAVSCLSDREGEDAQHTAELVQKTGRRCPIIRGDISTGEHAVAAVETTVRELGGWTC